MAIVGLENQPVEPDDRTGPDGVELSHQLEEQREPLGVRLRPSAASASQRFRSHHIFGRTLLQN